VVPKGPSSLPTRSAYEGDNENERTQLESGWEDEHSTTVAEQGDVAEKIRALGTERPDRAPQKTGVTATNMLEEPTVDDRRAQPAIVAAKPSAASARLVITAGNDKGNILAIQPGKTYTVGRAIDNDLVLTDIAVSRKHFDLKHEAGAWMLIDRRSGNGTLVNGNIEDNAFLLASGDVIEIGNTVFRFEMPGGLPRSHPASAMETPATVSLDQSMDAALEDVRGKRPPPPDEDDEDDEQSTVASKAFDDPPPPPAPPRARPATQAPPAPNLRSRPATSAPPPPIARARPATNAPPLPSPVAASPAPHPFNAPSPATTLPMHPARLAAQQPTILGDNKGLPIAPVPPSPATTMPGPGMPPVLYNNGYPMAAPMQPMGPAPAYGNPMMQGYASAQPTAGSRRTWLLVGAAGLAVAAAILTVLIIQAAAGDDDSPPEPADNKPPVASTEKTATAAAAKPTVEPIKPATPTPAPEASVAPIQPAPETPPSPAPEPTAEDTKPAVAAPKPEDKKPPKAGDSAAKAAAAAKQREAAAAKKERDEAARREREEAAARRREREEAAKREAKQDKRVAADTGGVKDKADGLYRNKNFAGAAAALRAAAKGSADATELRSLAGVYENFGKAYNVGMAPGTSPKQAFDLLVKAKNFDNRAGNAFTSEINARLAEIASKAAVAFMADKDYVRAKNAVAVAEAGGKGNSSTQGVKASLESTAAKLFKEAQAELASDEKSARDKLKQVQQMVDSKSQWHQKAGKLLSGG
jgi:pSer/pThr/pTyr-binding forkhead associated (FHA) protein